MCTNTTSTAVAASTRISDAYAADPAGAGRIRTAGRNRTSINENAGRVLRSRGLRRGNQEHGKKAPDTAAQCPGFGECSRRGDIVRYREGHQPKDTDEQRLFGI